MQYWLSILIELTHYESSTNLGLIQHHKLTQYFVLSTRSVLAQYSFSTNSVLTQYFVLIILTARRSDHPILTISVLT